MLTWVTREESSLFELLFELPVGFAFAVLGIVADGSGYWLPFGLISNSSD